MWSTHKVRTFFEVLKNEQQITTQLAGKATILTLCNYDFYNPSSQADGIVAAQSTAQTTAQSTAQSINSKSGKYKNNSQAEGRQTDRQTALIIREEDKEGNIKENLIKENPKPSESEEHQKMLDDWNARMLADEFEPKEGKDPFDYFK